MHRLHGVTLCSGIAHDLEEKALMEREPLCQLKDAWLDRDKANFDKMSESLMLVRVLVFLRVAWLVMDVTLDDPELCLAMQRMFAKVRTMTMDGDRAMKDDANRGLNMQGFKQLIVAFIDMAMDDWHAAWTGDYWCDVPAQEQLMILAMMLRVWLPKYTWMNCAFPFLDQDMFKSPDHVDHLVAAQEAVRKAMHVKPHMWLSHDFRRELCQINPRNGEYYDVGESTLDMDM